MKGGYFFAKGVDKCVYTVYTVYIQLTVRRIYHADFY